MTLTFLVLLGIVEGLTEFIPVSSTAHLIIFSYFWHLKDPSLNSLEIFIQLGAVAAVFIPYWQKFKGLLNFKKSKNGFSGWRGILLLATASAPVFLTGYLFHDAIQSVIFSIKSTALALIVGGLVMILVEQYKSSLNSTSSVNEITLQQAFLIGLFQCFSLWAGISRAASTIVGGIIVGLNRKTAVEFSFLLSVPVIFGAVSYHAYKRLDLLNSLSFVNSVLIASLVSFFIALFAIKWLLRFLTTHTLKPFGWYRIFLEIVLLILSMVQ